MFYPTVQETLVIDPLLSKNFSGMWRSLHRAMNDLKTYNVTIIFFILLRGFGSALSGFFAAMRGSLVHILQLHFGCSEVLQLLYKS